MGVTLGQDMSVAAARGRERLGDAAGRVADFVASMATADGGWRGRSRRSDLYYAAFGSGGLHALGRELPAALGGWLDGFGAGDDLDFVHLVCLARCHVNLRGAVPEDRRAGIAANLARFAAADGGWHPEPGAATGSLYGAFLGVGAAQDLGGELDRAALLAGIAGCRAADGGYGNLPGQDVGVTTLSAGAVVLRALCGADPDPADLAWLRGRLAAVGGFCPSPAVPLPDLLSTATALHALAVGGDPIPGAVRDPCLRFLDTVWNEERAAFCGHALDRTCDVEYTWYGLLALGHLGRIKPDTENTESTEGTERGLA
jgi:hypothetical protein